jgi:4-hydroxy-2-oxoheptanedioate aldolase
MVDTPRNLRAALRERRPLLATFVLIPRLEIIELLAAAGFGAVLLDLEHGPIGPAELPLMAAAAQGAGMFAIARVAEGTAAEIGRVLDAGVDGVLVPHVSSPEAARRLVEFGRFPPAGDRSINPYVRGTGYGDHAGLDAVNDRIALVAMLEGADALENLDAICAVDGLDGAFVGPVDLSAALGHPGHPEHPEVVAAVGDVLDRVSVAGLASGVYAPTAEAATRWLDRGAQLVALSADSAMALRGFRAGSEAVTAAAVAMSDVPLGLVADGRGPS